MKVIASSVHIMVVSSGVNDKLDIMRPMRGGVGHFNLLPIVVVVWNGLIKHAEPRWRSEVTF